MPSKSEVLGVLAEREFTTTDQQWFAAVSGDRNPMHMDPVSARRTMAGRPVVHGVHTLMWALDSLCGQVSEVRSIASIEARFERMIFVGRRVRAVRVVSDRLPMIVRVLIDDAVAMTVRVLPGEPAGAETDLAPAPLLAPSAPLEPSIEAMADCRGSVSVGSAAPLQTAFPSAAAVIGASALAGLAASTFIVGMVCPGLHSLFESLKLAALPRSSDIMQFRALQWDSRFRLLRLAVDGGGWTGSLDTRARPEPAAQPGLSTIASAVHPREFAGASALIVGGSRGLGELTAKILAAGGGEVSLTYATGEADARRVQAEIVDFGGQCDILRYEAQSDPGGQLDGLHTRPNQLFYMATPQITRRGARLLDQSVLDEFLAYYVAGFFDLCRELKRRGSDDLSIFYPSSVAVEERPANMMEYSMAKAAGEILCQEMRARAGFKDLHVVRLPRLPTDQTTTLFPMEAVDPVGVMLPIIQTVHAACRPAALCEQG